ncbi:MAG TPA: glycosyltransferase family A protein [Stenomitos sp.]
MLVFVIAVKHKDISTSWSTVGRLLERTLKSICNQTSDKFRVVVVCNQKPDVQFEHPSIHYVLVDIPPPILIPADQANKSGYAYVHSLDIARKNADKSCKFLKGIEYAQQLSPTHLMMMDADDCVNRRLAEWVAAKPHCEGWVMRKGYMYREGSKWIFVNSKRFNHVSGSSVIIRNDLYPALFKSVYSENDLYLCSFDTLPDINIQPLPFFGTVYSMMNGENILMSARTFSQMKGQILTRIPSLIQRVWRYRIWILTRSIVDDFGLYPILSEESSVS